MVELPELRTKTSTEAQATLIKLGLVADLQNVETDQQPPNEVVDMSPKPGPVPQNSTVTLKIAIAPTTVAVPDVVGKTQANATSILQAAGLNVTVGPSQASLTVPSGKCHLAEPVCGHRGGAQHHGHDYGFDWPRCRANDKPVTSGSVILARFLRVLALFVPAFGPCRRRRGAFRTATARHRVAADFSKSRECLALPRCLIRHHDATAHSTRPARLRGSAPRGRPVHARRLPRWVQARSCRPRVPTTGTCGRRSATSSAAARTSGRRSPSRRTRDLAARTTRRSFPSPRPWRCSTSPCSSTTTCSITTRCGAESQTSRALAGPSFATPG